MSRDEQDIELWRAELAIPVSADDLLKQDSAPNNAGQFYSSSKNRSTSEVFRFVTCKKVGAGIVGFCIFAAPAVLAAAENQTNDIPVCSVETTDLAVRPIEDDTYDVVDSALNKTENPSNSKLIERAVANYILKNESDKFAPNPDSPIGPSVVKDGVTSIAIPKICY